MADPRPHRMCDSCGGVDDHPRHVLATAPGESPTSPEVAEKALAAATEAGDQQNILAQIMDTSTVVKHMDCCAADGCPDGSCDSILKESKGKKGAQLVKFLTKEN